MPERAVIVQLSISAERLKRLYDGSARQVVATDDDGRTVRFPANILRSQVGHDGVHGRFRIDFDESGRFRSIVRLTAG